jgi:hypothetical protein
VFRSIDVPITRSEALTLPLDEICTLGGEWKKYVPPLPQRYNSGSFIELSTKNYVFIGIH